ncbi:MAG: NACHT domain-containing protein [Chloroflexota bacterium]
MLDNFLIDKTSYWIGFIAGLLALIAIKNGQPISGMFKEIIKQRFSMLRRGLSTSTEHRYRQDILKIFQTNHLAAPLFSLMEISMGARLLSPPLPVVPNGDVAQDNLTSLTIPYMPDWPEVGAIFGADTISFQEALSRGRNLLVMGKPGSGKTFALSQLVMQIAKRDTGLGEIRNLVPVMVHVGDLNVQATRKKLTDVLYLALAEKVSTLVEAQLSGFFESIFEAGLAMLIVDGMDELSPESQKPYIEFIKEIQEAYPDIRLIVATSTEFFAAVDVLDLYPMAMAAWRPGQSEEFFTLWGQLWEKHIASESWSKKLPNLADPVILKGWLGDNLVGDSPFMQTLKVWGLFAGDLSGLDSPDVIEAYINRMSVNVKNARPAMEHLAVQMVLNESPLTTRKSAGAFISTFEENDETETGIEPVAVKSTPSKPLSEDDFESLLDDLDNLDQAQIPEEVETDEQTIEPNSHIGIGNKNVRRMLPELAETRLMTYYPNGKIGFQHQIVSGYLAGRGLAVRGVAERLTSQPVWNGKTLAWAFLGSDVDISNLTESLSQNDKLDPLRRGLLAMGRWPRHAEKTATWRSNILRRLAGVLQYESLSMGLRARVLASLAFSGEKGMGSLFQQLMQSPQTSVIMLGIMGCGLTQYENVVTEVANFLYHPSIQVSQTACLALVAMNTTPALEYVAEALLHGDE